MKKVCAIRVADALSTHPYPSLQSMKSPMVWVCVIGEAEILCPLIFVSIRVFRGQKTDGCAVGYIRGISKICG